MPNINTLAVLKRLNAFPAKEVVDAGFLELVRRGIRKRDDPVIVDSLKVVDRVES